MEADNKHLYSFQEVTCCRHVMYLGVSLWLHLVN